MLEIFDIRDNDLQFRDIEELMPWRYAGSYFPQNTYQVDSVYKNQILNSGDNLTLKVSVTGTANSYQWTLNGVDIVGATSPTYTKSGITLGDKGMYICKVKSGIVRYLILSSVPMVVNVNAVAPVLASISPVSASINQEITIKGTSFSNVLTENEIFIGGKKVFAKSATGTELKVDVPVGVFGNVEVQVTVLSKTSNKLILPILPVVSDFSPTSGYLGDIVSIVGSGFSSVKDSNQVSFGNVVVPPSQVRSASINAISVTVPNGAKGSVPIKVKVGTQTGASATNFTVKGTEIQDFAPQEGYVGNKVNMLGLGFSTTTTDNQVFFGTTQAKVISASNNLLVVEVPTGIVGSVPLSLKLFGDTYLAANNFKLIAPTISEIVPIEGFNGETVSIIGNGFFSTVPADNVVLFGTTPATVTKATLTSLSVVVPAGVSGSMPVSVTKGGQTTNVPQPFSVKTPKFTEINPNTGFPDEVVSLLGEGFSPTAADNKVLFGTTEAVVSSASKNALVVKVPAVPKGATEVSVAVSGVLMSGKQTFTVKGAELQGFAPLEGYVGDKVNLIGIGFSSKPEDSEVFFGTQKAEITEAKGTLLVVKVPAGFTGEVSVSLKSFGETYTATDKFKLKASEITDITPEEGFIGETVSIIGNGFFSTVASENIVTFGTQTTVVSRASRTSLSVVVPAGVSGRVPVSVSKGGEKVNAPKNFNVKMPTFTDITPTLGYPDDEVSLIGEGFSTTLSQNKVLFGTAEATVTKATKFNLTVKVPKGNGEVKVSVNVAGYAIPQQQTFTIRNRGITDIQPLLGFTGDKVSIFGDGFASRFQDNKVYFGKVLATIESGSRTALTVLVPKDAKGLVPISVEVSKDSVLKAPKDKDFRANEILVTEYDSVLKIGDLISIRGQGFSTDAKLTKVMIGDKEARIVSISPERIVAVVPDGLSGKVNMVVSSRGDSKEGKINITGIVVSYAPLEAYTGDIITFKGTGLNPQIDGNEVLIDDQKVEILKDSLSTTQFKVRVPKGVGGLVRVIANKTRMSDLRVLTKVTGIRPSSASVDDVVTIIGTGFNKKRPSDNEVNFEGSFGRVVGVFDDSLQVRVGGGIYGEVRVNLLVADAKQVEVIKNFSIVPKIRSFDPSSRKGAPNQIVTIFGTGFSSKKGENKVFFGNLVANVLNEQNTEVVISLPYSKGKIPVTVQTLKQVSKPEEFDLNPEIIVIRPNGDRSESAVVRGETANINFSMNFEDSTLIELYQGDKKVLVIDSLSKTRRSYSWTVPIDIPLGNNYKIKVSSMGVVKVSDESDNPFAIVNESLDTRIVTNFPEFVNEGEQATPRITLGRNLRGLEVFFFYKATSATSFKNDLTPERINDSVFVAKVPFSAFDKIGVEYYFEIRQRIGRTTQLVQRAPRNTNGRTGIRYPSLPIPYTTFGATVEQYDILAMPLDLNRKKMAEVFDEIDLTGKKQNEEWRAYFYNPIKTNKDQSKKCPECEELSEATEIKAGQSFWMLIRNKPKDELLTGAGVTIPTSMDTARMYGVYVYKGWNQIGNPYLFPLDFENLKKANAKLGVSKLYISEQGSYVPVQNLKPLKGGFIFVENDGKLYFPPAPFDANSGGRVEADLLTNPIDSENWEVRFLLSSGKRQFNLGGLGMNRQAKPSKDSFDELTPPRFLEHLELNFLHPEYVYPRFAKDIIPTQENHVWEFEIDADVAEVQKTLSWDNTYFGSRKTLLLLDTKTNTVIDMSKENTYRFASGQETRRFKVYFGEYNFVMESLKPEVFTVLAFPNPFAEEVKFSLACPEKAQVYLQVYNSLGQVVHQVENNFSQSGFHQLTWKSQIANGVYFYQVQIVTADKVQQLRGKLVRE